MIKTTIKLFQLIYFGFYSTQFRLSFWNFTVYIGTMKMFSFFFTFRFTYIFSFPFVYVFPPLEKWIKLFSVFSSHFINFVVAWHRIHRHHSDREIRNRNELRTDSMFIRTIFNMSSLSDFRIHNNINYYLFIQLCSCSYIRQ